MSSTSVISKEQMTSQLVKGRQKKKARKQTPIPSEQFHALLKYSQQMKFLKSVPSVTPGGGERVIPYGFSHFFKGGQNPVIRLKLAQNIISITLNTVYSTVFTINASVFTNWTEIAGVFDEYRVLRGELQYWAALQTAATGSLGSNGIGGAALDYTSSAAMASFDAMQSHDTARLFHWYDSPGSQHKEGEPNQHWLMSFEPLPDESWIDTGTSNTAFCYWKPYLSSAQAAQTCSPGYVLGWMDFQFRGVSA